uniref:Uncharacterized protein n=1 Tax=Utricularia reniformis TaxID=192314 RepID=A0A1Y0B085_9LAMI|nr:hypothetical protein AEK19_MT0543 [Utricularia reniformis]ART30799.1 hypothetical protein AEK19_MT0543 [Utricularia reniformis]
MTRTSSQVGPIRTETSRLRASYSMKKDSRCIKRPRFEL